MTATESERRWALGRIMLGHAQIGGAVVSMVFLIQTGTTAQTLWAVTATCLCTTASVLLFGSRRPR